VVEPIALGWGTGEQDLEAIAVRVLDDDLEGVEVDAEVLDEEQREIVLVADGDAVRRVLVVDDRQRDAEPLIGVFHARHRALDLLGPHR